MMVEDYSKPWWEVFPDCATPSNKLKRALPIPKRTEIFIYRSTQVHGEAYDYSNSIYTKSAEPLIVTCTEHGQFSVTPANHITRGIGCPECSTRSKAPSFEVFTDLATKTHGGKYTYQPGQVINNKRDKVTIHCPVHGGFTQAVGEHLEGRGCIKCSKRAQSKSLSTFISQALEIHGDKYDYSLVSYVNSSTKVTIICKKHGPFEQRPAGHLNGRGCSDCSGTKRKTKQEFILSARKIHGDKYSYNEVSYANAHTKVKILCYDHGDFLQTPSSHLSGGNCPLCLERGDRKPPNQVYLLHITSNIYKIGITSNIGNRVSKLRPGLSKNGFGNNIKLVASTIELDDYKAVKLTENMLHKKYGNRPDTGGNYFDGHTELRTLTEDEALEIKVYLEGLTNESI